MITAGSQRLCTLHLAWRSFYNNSVKQQPTRRQRGAVPLECGAVCDFVTSHDGGPRFKETKAQWERPWQELGLRWMSEKCQILRENKGFLQAQYDNEFAVFLSFLKLSSGWFISMQGTRLMAGPRYAKILVSNHVAGTIIGTGGTVRRMNPNDNEFCKTN